MMLHFLESCVAGMWNEAGFPSISPSPGCPLQAMKKHGFRIPSCLPNKRDCESLLFVTRNCGGNFFNSFEDNYSELFSPTLESKSGTVAGNGHGDEMQEAAGTGRMACDITGLHPETIGESRRRLTARNPNKHQLTLNTSYQSKRLKTSYSWQQKSATIPGIMPLSKLPMRRSQKLGDKITALQQLVSPFGKTDTASVLQEAALSIKFLHEQIKVHAESSGSSSGDLRNRGLCLVPIYTILGLDLMDQTPCCGGWPDRANH